MKRYLYALLPLLIISFTIGGVAEAQGILPSSVQCSDDDTIFVCITSLYTFGVAAVTVLAFVVLVWGGFIWLTSGGNVSQIDSAKRWIMGSVLGLVIALSSFIILNTINPQLTTNIRVRAPGVLSQEQPLCCFYPPNRELEVSVAVAGPDCSNLPLDINGERARLCGDFIQPTNEIGVSCEDRSDCSTDVCYRDSVGILFTLSCSGTFFGLTTGTCQPVIPTHESNCVNGDSPIQF